MFNCSVPQYTYDAGSAKNAKRVCRYPGRLLTVKYEDVVVDLRRSAELIYRFVGVDSVPNDTRAWIEQNYAAVSQSINQSQLHSTDSNVSRVPPVKTGAPVRYTPPSEERSTRRVESIYLSPSEEWKKKKISASRG